MIEKVLKSPSLEAFFSHVPKAENFLVEKLWDSAKALLLCVWQKKLNTSILLITKGEKESQLCNDLRFLSSFDVFSFPSWEILPGEDLLPSADIIGKRMQILSTLAQKKNKSLVIAPLQAVLQKVVSKEALSSYHMQWKVGDTIPYLQVEEKLQEIGYKRVAVVSDKDEFAIRNGIIDVFPPTATAPYRIDFWQDEITSIRIFDILSQKTIQKADTIFLSIANEKKFLQFDSASLFDYLDPDTLVVFDDLVALEDEYVALQTIPGAKSNLLFSFSELLKRIKGQKKLFITHESIETLSEIQKRKKIGPALEECSFSIFQEEIFSLRFFSPFFKLYDYLSTVEENLSSHLIEDLQYFAKQNMPLIFLNDTSIEENALKEKLKEAQLPQHVFFERGYLSSGVVIFDLPLAILPNASFTQKHKIYREQNRLSYHTPVSEFHSLQEGDLVVHFHSGIGKYKGIEKISNIKGEENEFFVIEYAKSSKLFVPLSQSHLISRYIGSSEEVPILDVLGSNKWTKTKALAQKKILGYASELLHLYAERSVQTRPIYPQDSEEMQLFELDFPYEETADQWQAISDIKKDFSHEKIMDRLVCGDVGYGKTEVAMRAAFKVVLEGKKQVAVLVPTTVLASQHLETFSQRMGNFPIQIGAVSRFNTIKQNKQILEETKQGKIDILIGTHRILSQDVSFKDLGLLIIDEEQRFGVRAKEHLKKFKKNVDCLTLSATPIPRTLYLSLIKARDLSVISTPPQDRLPTKTILAETEDTLIQNALMREMLRSGQSFFIHNRVETIYQRASYIQNLIPRAKIAIVHGQMDAEDIDKVFHEFKHGRADILFATTLIENGIDIPNANTIIIDRADTFGISDLYQLRGRVGRWNRMAYAYFLINEDQKLSEIARKRLNALLEAGGYGGGMKIALRDLEIRGAGNILGVQQSGQVSQIGFHLYCKLLKKAIESLQNKKVVSFIETKIEIETKALIPSSYIQETSLRMEIYHKFGDASSSKELEEIFGEIQDRFGNPPQEVIWLYHIAKVRLFGSQNHFILLKFEKFSFFAQQQTEDKVVEKRIVYPKLPKTAPEWETATLFALQNNFICKENGS